MGANRRPLVEKDIVKPKGLTVDFDQNSLYWVDTFKATVEVVQFNGQGRRVIHQEEGTNFYGVALYNVSCLCFILSPDSANMPGQKFFLLFSLGGVV